MVHTGSPTLPASPFGGAESLAPAGAKDGAEPKGLAGAPGWLPAAHWCQPSRQLCCERWDPSCRWEFPLPLSRAHSFRHLVFQRQSNPLWLQLPIEKLNNGNWFIAVPLP